MDNAGLFVRRQYHVTCATTGGRTHGETASSFSNRISSRDSVYHMLLHLLWYNFVDGFWGESKDRSYDIAARQCLVDKCPTGLLGSSHFYLSSTEFSGFGDQHKINFPSVREKLQDQAFLCETQFHLNRNGMRPSWYSRYGDGFP